MGSTDEAPPASSDLVERRMRNTGQRDTPAELEVRRVLHARGLRYRVDQPIPGVTRARPDIVFPTERVAVFVDGCFWHACPTHGSLPKTNRGWWRRKLEANVERDGRHDRDLEKDDWVVLRFWEHEDAAEVADRVEKAVVGRREARESSVVVDGQEIGD